MKTLCTNFQSLVDLTAYGRAELSEPICIALTLVCGSGAAVERAYYPFLQL